MKLQKNMQKERKAVLFSKLDQLRKEFFILKVQFLNKNENFKNSSVFKKIRKKIARIKTILNKKKEKNDNK
ncbi:50S ribosomal protein L29 [Candidatus Riesia pediculicola]|uniref:Large ribosomal subunit protein uL29 n=1 Tax=Riesia pediculicola (strain USDA) TaxID=515618 RepID=D4G8M6_RIEPU|nr:ribosomal protein L29 [Candidatus Riesia pediculicola USDA]ARC53904.1 hypothetical protein AOE55_01960 [Candidatus Riesia pediculicola]QOJ86535.1 50S ribosomal protein L29 [Candidatus Riesia pediculicola]